MTVIWEKDGWKISQRKGHSPTLSGGDEIEVGIFGSHEGVTTLSFEVLADYEGLNTRYVPLDVLEKYIELARETTEG